MMWRSGFGSRIMPGLSILLTGLLGGAAFVCTMHHFANRAREQAMFLPIDRVPFDAEAIMAHVMNYALRSPEANDVVFIGDSTALCAIIPKRFEEHTGLHAYNMGTLGAIGVDGLAVVMRHYLEHHPRPRLIVLCIEAPLLVQTPKPERLRTRFLDMFTSGKHPWWPLQLDLPSITEESVLGMRGLLGNVGNIDSTARMPGPCRMTVCGMWQTLTRQRGYWAWPGKLPEAARIPLTADNSPGPVAPECQEGFRMLLRLAAAYDIPVLVRLSPIVSTAVGQDFAEVIAWLQKQQTAPSAHNPVVFLGQPDILKYPPAQFGEKKHLNRAGAEVFTAFVAEEVTKLLAELAVPAEPDGSNANTMVMPAAPNKSTTAVVVRSENVPGTD